MQSCSCLSIFLFMTAWRWSISAKFDRVTVDSKALSSYRFCADEQQSCSILALLTEGGAAVWALLWDAHAQRGGTKDPAVQKATKELAQAGGKRAASTEPSHWNCYTRSAQVPELGSPGGVRELPAGRARPCSPKEERGLTRYSSGTAFCCLCFRGRWQDSKGRRIKGSR